MTALIEFTYKARELLTQLDDAAVGALTGVFMGRVPAPEERKHTWSWSQELVIDVETEGPLLLAHGLTFEIKNFKGCMPISKVLPDGQKVTVHIQVPHIGLLSMSEVKVREDCCTDALQAELDNGWRILCVCPPNAARRPDYILGRSKPERD